MTSDGSSDSVRTLTTWPSPGVKPYKQGSLEGEKKPMNGNQREALPQSSHDHFPSLFSICGKEAVSGVFNFITFSIEVFIRFP